MHVDVWFVMSTHAPKVLINPSKCGEGLDKHRIRLRCSCVRADFRTTPGAWMQFCLYALICNHQARDHSRPASNGAGAEARLGTSGQTCCLARRVAGLALPARSISMLAWARQTCISVAYEEAENTLSNGGDHGKSRAMLVMSRKCSRSLSQQPSPRAHDN